jgi:NitT/TauT family transport system ATP-binding protein
LGRSDFQHRVAQIHRLLFEETESAR